MFRLSIDTSSTSISVALERNDKLVSTKEEETYQIAENLLGFIESILNQHQLKLSQVSEFVVCKGPGSFTGLRGGIATLQGIMSALDTKVSAISSLYAYSANKLQQNQQTLVTLEANKTDLFHSIFEKKEGNLISLQGEIAVSTKEEVKKFLAQNPEIKHLQLSELQQRAKLLADASKISPIADKIELVETHFSKHNNPADLLPLYVKPVNAKTLVERAKTS